MSAHILLINATIPYPPTSGNAIRVFGAAEALSQRYTCHLATFEENPERRQAVLETGVFETVDLLPAIPPSTNPLRHFRATNRNYLKWFHRPHYQHSLARLSQIVAEHRVKLVIAATLHLAEFLDRIPPDVHRVLDDYDCNTLTYERAIRDAAHRGGHRQRRTGSRHGLTSFQDRLVLFRTKYHENSLGRRYDAVVTIAPADTERLRQLNRHHADRVVLIPNGVNQAALSVTRTGPISHNSIVFWGHLSFPPNIAAVSWFYQEVFTQFLAKEGIEWHIIGGDAPAELRALESRAIHFHGFVDNLYATAIRYPVFVNPQTRGSGFKNKLVEAFALGHAVVTTPLGIESIPEALQEVHYLPARDGREMARQILRLRKDPELRESLSKEARALARRLYSWRTVGGQWRALVAGLLEP